MEGSVMCLKAMEVFYNVPERVLIRVLKVYG
jgi:hypothetical protein